MSSHRPGMGRRGWFAVSMTLVSALATTLLITPSAPAGAASCVPPAPTSPDYYAFVHTYNPACATTKNWDRTFNDVTVTSTVDSTHKISVTGSTSLAGAVASLKINNKEFIASGGNGSAFQYAFHAWADGKSPSECYNPTQAGARVDSDGQAPPFHAKSSTSALYQLARDGSKILRTQVRPAMFVTRADPRPGYGGCRGTDLQPAGSPFDYGLSPYWLHTRVGVGKDAGISGWNHVIRLSATLESEDKHQDNFDGVLVAYLQRDFTEVYAYNPSKKKFERRTEASTANAHTMLRCTPSGVYCLGMYLPAKARKAGAYYYSQTRGAEPANGGLGEANLQVTYPTPKVDKGDRLTYNLYVAVGHRSRVESTLTKLSSKVG